MAYGRSLNPLATMAGAPLGTGVEGQSNGLAYGTHDVRRVVVDGRQADARGARHPDARRHRALARGKSAGRRAARARAILLRQPPRDVPRARLAGADRDLVPA